MIATCAKCGTLFDRAANEGWKRLCYACWKGKRDAETSTLAYWQEQAALWRRRFNDLEAAAGQRHNGANLERELLEQLPRLLLVAHPDRHGNSQASTKATQWLLSVKARLQ